MTASKVFLCLCLSFIGGIFLSSNLSISLPVLLAVLILGLVLISVFWRHQKLVVFGFCILFLVAGIWRHQVQLTAKPSLIIFNDKEKEVTLIGIVQDEPVVKEKITKLTLTTEQLITDPIDWGEARPPLSSGEDGPLLLKGKVLVTAWKYPEYRYGDKLEITGILKSASEDINGFNYKNYLAKDGIYSVMDFPRIELIGAGFGNSLMKTLFSFKNKFKEISRQFISPPQLGILEALFFGDEENIPQVWKNKLNFTGTRHITAVSGMNITIVAFLISNFLLLLGFWRNQAFYISIILLTFYILMVGASASAVRAGIMGGLLLLSQKLGRMSQALRAVVIAATLMLILNPLLLKLDVGFQLSFLAILGMIYFQPSFSRWLKKFPNYKFFPLGTTLSTTLAAQIFTLPILVYNFGYIPLTSPISNILIVPLLASITILIFIFGMAGMISWPLGWIFSWSVWLFLTYIVKIIDFFSRLPFSSFALKSLSWVWLVIFYLVLSFLVWRLQEREKLKFLRY